MVKGDVNPYCRYAGTKEWDVASGHAIIKEVNCSIIDLNTMSKPVYNKFKYAKQFFYSIFKSH